MESNSYDNFSDIYDAILFGYPFYDKINVSICAYDEASNWRKYGKLIENESIYNQGAYIMLTYSIELYFKCLLSICNHNILDKKYKIHDLNELFYKLPLGLQTIIINNIEISTIDVIDKNDNILYTLTSFDEYMREISDSFIKLRYEYEKFNNGKLIFIPIGFINKLVDTLYIICTNAINKI